MSTEEGNKLIGRFMGYKIVEDWKEKWWSITKPEKSDWFFGSYSKEEFNSKIEEYFQYHASWDWLMPVMEKIFKEHKIPIWSGYDIMPNWEAVIKFIQWYNQTLNP